VGLDLIKNQLQIGEEEKELNIKKVTDLSA